MFSKYHGCWFEIAEHGEGKIRRKLLKEVHVIDRQWHNDKSNNHISSTLAVCACECLTPHGLKALNSHDQTHINFTSILIMKAYHLHQRREEHNQERRVARVQKSVLASSDSLRATRCAFRVSSTVVKSFH
jgi:hypothetical protein